MAKSVRNAHGRFRYKTVSELLADVEAMDLELGFSADISPLLESVQLRGRKIPNRLVINPMEGCDGTPTGEPDELTYRRYSRFARGGSGLLWFEATAVVPEGRANPRQLYLHSGNAAAFKDLLEHSLAEARDAFGSSFRPVTVLQLTHSGRYSRPSGARAPVIAFHDPILDCETGVTDDQVPISDGELEKLQDSFVQAALLARDIGFDAVDLKHCHRYLMSELLAAHTRPGRFGGSLENRTRFLLDLVEKVQDAVGDDLLVTTRLNVYDGHLYPYGWGVKPEEGSCDVCLDEPVWLVKQLAARGVGLINVTAGNPYHSPHINRPFDAPVKGGYIPSEHPLVGVERLVQITRVIQEAVPEVLIVGSGYSWLRQFFPQAGAYAVSKGWTSLVGVGREAFAYPDYAKDLMERGQLDPRKCCITCSRCTQIMRDGGRTGCPVFDRDLYLPILQAGLEKNR